MLTVEVARSVLLAYLEGEVQGNEVEAWAEALEGGVELSCQAGAEELLRDLVMELANPGIVRPLTEETAWQWLGRIPRAVGPSPWDELDLDGIVDRAARAIVSMAERPSLTYDVLRPTMRLVVRRECVVLECHYLGSDLFVYPGTPEEVEPAIDGLVESLVVSLQHELDHHSAQANDHRRLS